MFYYYKFLFQEHVAMSESPEEYLWLPAANSTTSSNNTTVLGDGEQHEIFRFSEQGFPPSQTWIMVLQVRTRETEIEGGGVWERDRGAGRGGGGEKGGKEE